MTLNNELGYYKIKQFCSDKANKAIKKEQQNFVVEWQTKETVTKKQTVQQFKK